MPLPKPALDTRTFDQLVAESRSWIPPRAPAWTDFNISDPGITLLELFAWLAEQDFYRFDRVSPETLRAFLRLVGVAPLPPQVARTVVTFATTASTAATLPARTQIADSAGGVMFETAYPLTVSPATVARVFAGGGSPADVTEANEHLYEPDRDPVAGTFQPFGSAPAPGSALIVCVDVPLGAAGDELSLHVWTTTPEQDAARRAAIVAEWQETQAALAKDCPAVGGTLEDWRQHYSARTRWEYQVGPDTWKPLEQVEDETRALTLTGFVRFRAPSGHVVADYAPFFAIRCRLVRGGFECPPRIDRIDINAVTAEHAETINAEELLGISRGHARETYLTARQPVVPASTQLTLVKVADSDATWREVPEWDETGPLDRAYRVEYEAGRLSTGDGMRGQVAPADWELRLRYRVGGGTEGNVAAETIQRLPATPLNVAQIPDWATVSPELSVHQAYAAFGGAPGEPLAHAQARAIEALAAPRRAVTLGDVARLAREAPGLAIARAYAIANHHPVLPCVPAPGCVTAVVVPDCPGPRPTPSADLLSAVERYLGRRRLMTTEIHAVAPHYVGVAVHATLHVNRLADPAASLEAARGALDAFFDPLTGGPDGAGWPAGRGVYRTEVMALLATVAGIERVTDLGLQIEGEEPDVRCANIDVCPTDLIASGRHRLVARFAPAHRILQRSIEHECP